MLIVTLILITTSHSLFFSTSASHTLKPTLIFIKLGCPNTRRSTTIVYMVLSDSTISWKCMKQD